jgi:3-isopropylmalate dehydrogenase
MKIAVLAGDGIGPEVTREAVKVLKAAVGPGAALALIEAPIGGAGVDAAGDPLPAETLRIARDADAILFGAAGVPGDEALPYEMRPGASLLRLRKDLQLFANFRPAFLFDELVEASTLKREVVEGLDILILRELTGDLYFGEPRGFRTNAAGEREAFNTMLYSEPEIERIAHVAFQAARKRGSKVCSVDKANVLEVMQLWREVVTRVGQQYPDVELSHMFVDAAVMVLMKAPKSFDVIVTGNVFGDILSDGAAMLTGSIGMLPTASLGVGKKGLYEPVHGSAPDIAGTQTADPTAAILSAALLLDHLGLADAAARVTTAVTADLASRGAARRPTSRIGDAIALALG